MNRFKIKNRSVSLLIVLAIYALAFFIGLLVLKLSGDLHALLAMFLADVAATLVVWAFGILFANSSVYDPYWSIAPIIIISYWILAANISFSVTNILFLTVAAIWGIRLTINWITRWRGFSHQDWRYTMFRERSPRMWFLTNLTGINLMPTVIVFLALIPAYFGIGHSGPASIFTGIITGIGFAICIGAVLIQAISDIQMDLFKKSRSSGSKHIDIGLWRHSRHPNYFGEVSFWWGIWLMQMGTAPERWQTVAGPVLMTLLFVFISIPMMEKHVLASRPSYIHYQKKVSMLKPWFRKK